MLGQPRISSVEFYFKNREKGELLLTPDDSSTVIAGRKFYWHAPNKRITEDDEFAKQNPSVAGDNCIELVKANQSFSFEIYFNGISKRQLKMLVFDLNFGENEKSSTLCHKIGHGKPLGLGSVKIVVDNIIIRTYENGKYEALSCKDKYLSGAELFNDSDVYKQLIRAADLKTIKNSSLIMYPKTADVDSDSRNWFMENRDIMRIRVPGMPRINRYLPNIMAENQTLPIFDMAKGGSNEKRQGNFGKPKNNSGGRNNATNNPYKKFR